MPLLGQVINFDTYYANNAEYTKDFASGKWTNKLLSADEYDRVFQENNDSEVVNANDVLCAGLVEEDSENPNEIILKGNVYLNEILNQVNEKPEHRNQISIRFIWRYLLTGIPIY